MEILISDRQNINVNQDLVKELSKFVLRQEKAGDESEISVSFVQADEIKSLNKNYRQIDKVTDVLSFSFNDNETKSPMLGDVVLCLTQVQKKAKEQAISFDEYFSLLVVHSTLHLLGYSHETDEHAKVMIDRENQLLEEFGHESKSFK